MESRNRIAEFLVEKGLIRLSGYAAVVVLLLILSFMLREGLPFLGIYSASDFLFKTDWYPLSSRYGMLPLLTGSLMVTLIALVLAMPLAIGTAIFMSEVAPPAIRNTFKILLEILASIPSVVFGFLGIIILGPWVQKAFGVPTGLNAFSAGILLAFMALPTIASVADEAMQAVPRSLREASLALGASRIETIFKITFPAASSGVIAGVMLGVGRAIGETMTVMMVAGGSAQIALNPLAPVRTMTGTIAAEMGEVVMGDDHYRALFMIGLLLFAITLGINTISGVIIERIRRRQGS
ncbi:phosphate ABC transporter permease subunit PstC [Turneriella parva]|uniref:Phosphate transport system permease protein n=1 Tax=Turneriella parva (strain ATCC BAA-1111 / DSM 21527 / NCTC 11395 / H) TaxID=869212 RepID=I4BBP6_TURPD|nr:phosphate ABC transporter permease subunit PstC [Turneriella parva]AFM14703.1 phosphate ABC transporter membrane protein 1, PhoT family [Turneriella parva DSM 21527]